ncbi:MAG: HEAT repeat domain-containing protein [Gammaproteobacteria bacterium]|nr:HEAT repeat domain-containing protein [Gammaproteobacteria bacterium]
MTLISINAFYYIKWAAIVEICLVILLIVFAYSAQFYYRKKAERRVITTADMEKLFVSLASTSEQNISHELNFFKKNLPVLLQILPRIEAQSLPHWPSIQVILVEKILKPKARRYAKSRRWSKRYFAVRCFSYGWDARDEPLLAKLIVDHTFLISLNAALVAVKKPTQSLVDTLIDFYSKGRRLQQSIFSAKFVESDPAIGAMVSKRLAVETDPYILAFCYSLLTKLPVPDEMCPTVIRDINSAVIDLKIAALKYLAHQGPKTTKIIRRYLSDEHWQVRVVVIKLLSALKDYESLDIIGKSLQDEAWWVRMDAAQALMSFGEKGEAILRSQDPEVDRYAYEVATRILQTSKQLKE